MCLIVLCFLSLCYMCIYLFDCYSMYMLFANKEFIHSLHDHIDYLFLCMQFCLKDERHTNNTIHPNVLSIYTTMHFLPT